MKRFCEFLLFIAALNKYLKSVTPTAQENAHAYVGCATSPRAPTPTRLDISRHHQVRTHLDPDVSIPAHSLDSRARALTGPSPKRRDKGLGFLGSGAAVALPSCAPRFTLVRSTASGCPEAESSMRFQPPSSPIATHVFRHAGKTTRTTSVRDRRHPHNE